MWNSMTFVKKEYESNNAMDITLHTVVMIQALENLTLKQNVMEEGMFWLSYYFTGLFFLELLESIFLISQPASFSERKLFVKPGIKSWKTFNDIHDTIFFKSKKFKLEDTATQLCWPWLREREVNDAILPKLCGGKADWRSHKWGDWVNGCPGITIMPPPHSVFHIEKFWLLVVKII